MQKNIQPIGPPCEKCKQPMTFHSVQDVPTRDGHGIMQVYECETCNRLAAFRGLTVAAAD
jgi:hypothetical protein